MRKIECLAQAVHLADVRSEDAAGRQQRKQLLVGGQEI